MHPLINACTMSLTVAPADECQDGAVRPLRHDVGVLEVRPVHPLLGAHHHDAVQAQLHAVEGAILLRKPWGEQGTNRRFNAIVSQL